MRFLFGVALCGIISTVYASDPVLGRWKLNVDTSPETMLGQVTEESLHHVQPRRTGGSEVDMESRVALEPALNLGMLVCGVVVHDEM